MMGPGSGAIYAQASRSRCAVTSVMESELLATCDACDTSMFVTNACQEMGYDIPNCRSIYVDNQAEIRWVEGSVPSKKSRHMEVRVYRVRHKQNDGDIKVKDVRSEDNIADLLTKPLPGPQFRRLAGKMLGHDLVRKTPGVIGLLGDELKVKT